jgi:dTDP-4-amino-4,6-dideoxygalactose transaminase
VISTGDGGMITTNRLDYYERLRLLRQHGMSVNDRVRHESSKVIFEEYVEVGYNYRMTDIQAAVGIKQLEKLDWLVEERRKIAAAYHEAFKDIECIRLPEEPANCCTNWQSYSIYLRKNAPIDRNTLMQRLLDEGIATRRGVMTTHTEIAYKNTHGNIKLPVSEDLHDRSIILPLYVPMTKHEIQKVVDAFVKLIQ